MYWQNAIKLSPVKTASRFEDIKKGFKKVTIIYPDGNGIVMITACGMVMCAYHIAVNLPQTFKGTLTIPLVTCRF